MSGSLSLSAVLPSSHFHATSLSTSGIAVASVSPPCGSNTGCSRLVSGQRWSVSTSVVRSTNLAAAHRQTSRVAGNHTPRFLGLSAQPSSRKSLLLSHLRRRMMGSARAVSGSPSIFFFCWCKRPRHLRISRTNPRHQFRQDITKRAPSSSSCTIATEIVGHCTLFEFQLSYCLTLGIVQISKFHCEIVHCIGRVPHFSLTHPPRSLPPL